MTLAPALLAGYPELNDAQRQIVGSTDGPLLVIAGPGSGKTFSLVLRTLNILMLGKAEPAEVVLCTFTEKAAFELRDRLGAAAAKAGYQGDLSTLRVGTIHSICRRMLDEHRHRTPLGSSFETLDELTQLLFLYEHFEEIVGRDTGEPYLGKWRTKWTAIAGLQPYFDKITEELVEPKRLADSESPFLRSLAAAYTAYRGALFAQNRLDFAHLQRVVHDLLLIPEVAERVTSRIKYVLVDEYQDTNFIQEQVLLKLSGATGHICVVGDEDQSLYRFRGATVRNILEFPARVPGCATVKLTTNYRSHRAIVAAYDGWMASADWSNPGGRAFRYEKTIHPNAERVHPDYPAVFSIWGRDANDEAERFASLVADLRARGIIGDYNQVALLLHSVRSEHSGTYLGALVARGIPAFCPRARAYFENEEVRLMVACYAIILGYHGEGRGELRGPALAGLAAYVDTGLVEIGRRFGGQHPLSAALRKYVSEIAGLAEGAALDRRPADTSTSCLHSRRSSTSSRTRTAPVISPSCLSSSTPSRTTTTTPSSRTGTARSSASTSSTASSASSTTAASTSTKIRTTRCPRATCRS